MKTFLIKIKEQQIVVKAKSAAEAISKSIEWVNQHFDVVFGNFQIDLQELDGIVE